MPACLASTRNTVLSLILVCTVARHAHFKNAVGHRRGVDAKLNVHRGRFLLQQNGRRIGLLQRRLLEVDALNLENGSLLICHGGLSGQNKARCWMVLSGHLMD